MENNKKYIIFCLLGILLIAVACYFIFFNGNDNNQKEKTNDFEEIVDLSSWAGSYSNGVTSIELYQSAKDGISINVITDYSYTGYDIEANSNDKIVYEDEYFGEDISIVIEKKSTGIKINASSSNDESPLNSITGEYEKEQFETLGWNGVYEKDQTLIFLNEITDNYLRISVNGKTFSYSTIADDYDDKNIIYSESFPNENIEIEKTEDGIKVTASAEENEELNDIDGIYILK